ncbi:MAG: hypothetical protein WA091_00360 [Minisyncoccales bacterium]
MTNLSKNKALILILGIILIFCFTYLFIFGRALKQEENHIGIALALPKLLFTDAVKIDDEKYLAKDVDSFIKAMEKQGFISTDQMGAGLFLEKGGNKYLVISRMYSSLFMVFTYPSLID